MANQNLLAFHQSSGVADVPGMWKLGAGRVLSLQPRQTGVLRVAQGQVWATVDARPCGHGNELGDFFLRAGQQLEVEAGQRLVLESLAAAGEPSVFFEWTAAPVGIHSRTIRANGRVAQSLRDLGFALGLVGGALVRLGAGLMAYGRQWMPVRAVAPARHCG